MKGFKLRQRPGAEASFQFMTKFIIPNFDDPDEIYLTRYRIIQTPWFSVYLHRMDGPDSRPTLHDHPWAFISLILRGGYREKRWNLHDRSVWHKDRRWLNIMRRDDAHAIEYLFRKPTWTLLLVGKRRRKWGYWTEITLQDQNLPTGRWMWTEFDRHPYNSLFLKAQEHRRWKKEHTAAEGTD